MINADERKKFYQDNRGDALPMVLVIIAFIAILAAVLMFVAYAGYRMRLVDRQGTDNFYTAETVLDEINVKLQEVISQALSETYDEIMINYALYSDASARNSAFRTLYFDKLKKELEESSYSGHYRIDVLRGYLSEESLGNGTDADGSREKFEENIENSGTESIYGAIVESDLVGTDEASSNYFVLEANNTRLLLKDLRVSYINENGYISMISTDIRIDLPSFTFSQAAALPSLENCSMIADDTLFMGNTAAGAGITVQGDVYAGQMFVGNPEGTVYSALNEDSESRKTVTPSESLLAKTDVIFKNIVGMSAANEALVVSRGDINVSGGSELATDNTELWGQNLTLSSATADLSGNINLKDDLTLSGTGSKASLSGEYTGFGYLATASNAGNNGSGSTDEDDENDEGEGSGNPYAVPDASSAIVINGRDSELDLSGLNRLTISGRAYVATAYNANNSTGETFDREKDNKSNVMMGESVAVKSNQLIYLVPSEALGCVIEENDLIGESMFNANPLTLEQYEELTVKNPDKYVLLDGTKQIPSLDYQRLSKYIDQVDLAGGGSAYMPEVVFRQTNAGPLVYCYLRFKDEDAANQYFRDFYKENTEYVTRYTELYAKDIKMNPDDLLFLYMKGNMLVYDGEEADTWSVVSSLESTGTDNQAQRISALKDDSFKSLSVKLVRSSALLTDIENGRTAFPNIIDELEVENVLYAAGVRNTVEINTKEDGTGSSMVLTKEEEYVVPDDAPDIIVSLGNVTVKNDFKGLIIAKGNITIATGRDITLEPLDINTFSNILLTEVKELSDEDAGDIYYLMNVFVDGLSYAYSGNAAYDAGTSRVSIIDLISYERWTKK